MHYLEKEALEALIRNLDSIAKSLRQIQETLESTKQVQQTLEIILETLAER